MSGYLLDTNVALMAVLTPEDLPARIREAVEEGPAYLSVISYWEVMIKSMKGMLGNVEPTRWWYQTIADFQLISLPFKPAHVTALAGLPLHHGDPFDRALIAVALAEGLSILSTHAMFKRYVANGITLIS